MTTYRWQCKKCGRHNSPIEVLEQDPKTKKKWWIRKCIDCEQPFDIKEFDEEND